MEAWVWPKSIVTENSGFPLRRLPISQGETLMKVFLKKHLV